MNGGIKYMNIYYMYRNENWKKNINKSINLWIKILNIWDGLMVRTTKVPLSIVGGTPCNQLSVSHSEIQISRVKI